MTVPDFPGESIGYDMHFGRPGSLMVSVRALLVLAGDMSLGKALNSDSHSVSLHPGV